MNPLKLYPERRRFWLLWSFILAVLLPQWTRAVEPASIEMYFYSSASDLGSAGGLTDATLPDRIVWVTLQVNAHSAINGGRATVTLPPGWTFEGVRNDIEIWDDVETSGQDVTLVIPDQSGESSRYGGFGARIFAKTPSLDDLPPTAPTFEITTQLDLDTDDGHVGDSYSYESKMLYTRATIVSNKAGQTIKGGDVITYTVDVAPYPHFDVVYASVAAYAPLGTDFVEGSISGLNGGSINSLGYIFAEYPSGGARSFNFSYQVQVREDWQLDYANITEFKPSPPSVQFRVRTPFAGNNNSPDRDYHRRIFTASVEPYLALPREAPPEVGTVVNSTRDLPRDPTRDDCGTGETIGNGDPECTLRSVIEGALAGIVDEVNFGLQDEEIPTITLSSALPAITKPIKIDGTTQSAGMVEVKANGLNAYGLDLQGGDSEVRGLIISGFKGAESAGIRLKGGQGNVIAGNWIGVSKDGNSAAEMDLGILVEDSAGNTIGGPDAAADQNIVYGVNDCVEVRGDASDNNQIVGNRIGLGKNGEAFELALGGVVLRAGDGAKVGGAGSLGNWIAAQTGVALSSRAPYAGPIVEGNRIGLEADGKTATNGNYGIVLSAKEEEAISGARIQNNRIAGTGFGILSTGGEGLLGVVIDGNQIGLDFNDHGALPDGLTEDSHRNGIRLESVSQHAVSHNRVAGFTYNVLLTGASQFNSDTDGAIHFYNPDSPLSLDGDEPIGSGNAIEENDIGLNAATSVPAGKEQRIGLSLFANPKDLIVRNNTIAGHVENDVLIANGSNIRLGGNRIGTTTGADYGGKIGVAVYGGSDIVIGASGDGAGNVISREDVAGIVVSGEANNVTIKDNKIGADVGATSAWANATGILLEPNYDDKHATGVVIDGNVIAGNTKFGIASTLTTEVQMRNNRIGVNANGLPLPNKVGASFEGTPLVSRDDTFAHNSEAGLKLFGDQAVFVESPSVYENGDGERLEGIVYEDPPIDEPSKVFALRYKPDENNMTRVLVAVAPPQVENAVVELFGNRSTDEFQGRTPLDRQSVLFDEPYFKEWELPADSSIAQMDNFTATYTIGGKTSEFSAPAAVKEALVPDLRVSDPVDNKITLVWSLLEYFRIVSAPSPAGPWEPIELDPEKVNGLYAQEVELTESAQFFRLELDITAAFEYE